MTAITRFLCDHPECKSMCELSDVTDLKNVKKALEARGWSCTQYRNGKEPEHLCPAHAKHKSAEPVIVE